MDFGLDFRIPKTATSCTHKDHFVLLGSCFSDEMSEKFRVAGFSVTSNPFGTLFHPTALSNAIHSALTESREVDIHQHQDLYFAWDCSGKVYGTTKDSIASIVYNRRQLFKANIKRAKVLVVTFGTAWGYHHTELDTIVGNCHKEDASSFTKVLSDVDELFENWSKLIQEIGSLNPELKIIFTVSPVRHKKDGLIENNRSKARLIELVHKLSELEGVEYFPSYEILIDELRDYRFYAEDRVHPSKEAVAYIWKRFQEFILTTEAIELGEKVVQVRKSLDHQSLYPESEAATKHKKSALSRKEELTKEHPEVNWN